MISGFEWPDNGAVFLQGTDVTREPVHRRAHAGIARTFQIVQPFANLSVVENVMVGAYLRTADRSLARHRAIDVMRRVGLEREHDKPAESLTIAGRKRLELARAVATEPKLLLLDEVLAGLNPAEVRDMLPVILGIRDRGVTILMVEHVMQAVMQLSERVIVLAEGKLIADGKPDKVVRDERVIEAYLGHGAHRRLVR
jgi:branched-chain amino acid transport system ATP-binding protein